MSKISLELIQRLRQVSGLGMLDCKKALEEANGDFDKAVELLRKKGASIAAKRSDKETAEGIIHAYIHPGSQIGVLVEVNCETDFVARTEDIKKFAQDLCLHITALKPMYLKPEDVDAAFLDRERSLTREQLASSGKPDKIIDQIVDGKINKLYSEICLMNQTWVKNDQMTVEDARKELVGKVGENISIRRFARYEVGA
jgi:elongation factor Ts